MSGQHSDEEVQQGPSPIKKNKMGKIIDEQRRIAVINLYVSNLPNQLDMPMYKIVRSISDSVGIGKTTVDRIIKEYRENKTMTIPKTKRSKPSIFDKLSDFEKNAVRMHVHRILYKGEIPTVNKIHKAVSADSSIQPISRTNLFRLIKTLGFRYTKRNSTDSSVYGFCDTVDIKTEIDDSIQNNLTVSSTDTYGLCEIVNIKPEIDDSINNNLTESIFPKPRKRIIAAKYQKEHRASKKAKFLKANTVQNFPNYATTPTSATINAVQDNKIHEQQQVNVSNANEDTNSILSELQKRKNKAEYQRAYRAHRKAKLLSVNTVQNFPNYPVTSTSATINVVQYSKYNGMCDSVYIKPEIDDSIENNLAGSYMNMHRLCETVYTKPEIDNSTKHYSTESSVYGFCETVNTKTEIDDSIKNNMTDSNGMCDSVYIKPEIDDSIENNLAGSYMNMHRLCEIVDIKPELDDLIKHYSTDSSVYGFCETVNIKNEINDSIKNNMTDSIVDTDMHGLCETVNIKPEVDGSIKCNSTD